MFVLRDVKRIDTSDAMDEATTLGAAEHSASQSTSLVVRCRDGHSLKSQELERKSYEKLQSTLGGDGSEGIAFLHHSSRWFPALPVRRSGKELKSVIPNIGPVMEGAAASTSAAPQEVTCFRVQLNDFEDKDFDPSVFTSVGPTAPPVAAVNRQSSSNGYGLFDDDDDEDY